MGGWAKYLHLNVETERNANTDNLHHTFNTEMIHEKAKCKIPSVKICIAYSFKHMDGDMLNNICTQNKYI